MTFAEGPAEEKESSRFSFPVEEKPEVDLDTSAQALDLVSSFPMASKVNWLTSFDKGTTSLPP